VRKLIAIAAAAALVTSSTVAVAAPSMSSPATIPPQTSDAWIMLGALSATPGAMGSAAICGTAAAATAAAAAAAAAQPAPGCVFPQGVPGPVGAAPPSPPPPFVAGFPAFGAELLPILLMAALIAVALGITGRSGEPNSPG